MEEFKNRIVGDGMEDPSAIELNPLNWRTHPEAQEKALEQVLDEVGYVQRVIINKRTNRLVDGHLRVELARKRNEAEIPVVYVDINEQEEALILATIDPLSALAGKNDDILEQLLSELAPELQPIIEGIGIKGISFGEEDTNPRLDEITESTTKCPECGHEFKP